MLHPDFRTRARKRLFWAAILTFSLCAVEFVGGLWSGSLALLSDAGHMLADLLAITLSLVSIAWATKPADQQKTYGNYRFEILASLVNGALLLFVAFQIVWEAIHRFMSAEPINLRVMLPIAVVGLLINLVCMGLLHSQRAHMVTRSALLHVIGDAISSAGVVIAGVIIHFTGWLMMDALISILIAILIARSAYRLLREAVEVLLEASPTGVQPEKVRQSMLEIEGVKEVHDLHVWTISSGFHAASAHLLVSDMSVTQSEKITTAVSQRLREKFSIAHTTLEVGTMPPPTKIPEMLCP